MVSVGSFVRYLVSRLLVLHSGPNWTALCSNTYLRSCNKYLLIKHCVENNTVLWSPAVSHACTLSDVLAGGPARAVRSAPARLPCSRPLCLSSACCWLPVGFLASLSLDAWPPLHLPHLSDPSKVLLSPGQCATQGVPCCL